MSGRGEGSSSAGVEESEVERSVLGARSMDPCESSDALLDLWICDCLPTYVNGQGKDLASWRLLRSFD